MNRYHYAIIFSIVFMLLLTAIMRRDYLTTKQIESVRELKNSTAFAIECATKDTKDYYLSANYTQNIPYSFFKGFCLIGTRYSRPQDLYAYTYLIYFDKYGFYIGYPENDTYKWLNIPFASFDNPNDSFWTNHSDIIKPDSEDIKNAPSYHIAILNYIEKFINDKLGQNIYSKNYFTEQDEMVFTKQLYQNSENTVFAMFVDIPTTLDDYFYTGLISNTGSFSDK